MRIVTISRLNKFVSKHVTAKVGVWDWYTKTKASKWQNISEIKATFNSVDYVGNDRFVFNISGHNYRLIAIVIFASQKVYIRFIGTHKEYDKLTDIKTI